MRISNDARQHFNEHQFQRQVAEALRKVRQILDTSRKPTYAADVHHHYDDKYLLAEHLTNVAVASQLNVLDRLGLDARGDGLINLRALVHQQKKEITLRYEASRTCTFVEERKTKVESPHEYTATVEETTKKGLLESKTKTTSVKHRVINEVTEYLWKVEHTHRIHLYAGSDPEQNQVVLQNRTAHADVITAGKKDAPYPASVTVGPFDASLTWLLQNVSTDGAQGDDDGCADQCRFKIDRDADTCKTPRRNEDVEKALTCFAGIQRWCEQVKGALLAAESIQLRGDGQSCGGGADTPSTKPEAKASLSSINAKDLFVPVLPLFEEKDGGDDDAGSPLLSVSDTEKFLAEQCRSMDGGVAKLEQTFPKSSDETALISSLEARLYLLSLHTAGIVSYHSNGIQSVEAMLQNQLVAAIGKTISESDFYEYMSDHNGKLLFKDQYAPTPFSYAVRRENHSPDGIISIERSDANGKKHPIVTTACKLGGASPSMYLPINAATSVELGGDTYLHGWLNHRFGSRPDGAFTLSARARQFSSFMLLVGKISGPGTFEAKDAIILQNKDELLIPLILNQLPSPKEFKDAIVSLSPEQRRFAEAFRSMQLQSSVFGVCCIQLKPQLETLLGLPPDALTKEVRLTQDLLSLFIEYQIPSDLLSYDGASEAKSGEKVDVVKKHTKNVLDMIDSMKERDLRDAAHKADMAFELNQAAHPPVPVPASAMYCGVGGAPEEMVEQSAMFRSAAGAAPRRLMAKSKVAPTGAAIMARSSAAPLGMMNTCSYAAPPQPQMAQQQMSIADAFDYDEAPVTRQEGRGDGTSSGVDASRAPTDSLGSPELRDDNAIVDFTAIPKQLDAKFEALDKESALRATTIKTADRWTKMEQKNLLSKMEQKLINPDMQKSEKDKAFDLLDALSRSGSLPISCSELHVIVCCTHSFDHSIIDTCIKDNVNPIEKVENSSIIIAATIQRVPPKMLLKNEAEVARMKQYSPLLICDDDA